MTKERGGERDWIGNNQKRVELRQSGKVSQFTRDLAEALNETNNPGKPIPIDANLSEFISQQLKKFAHDLPEKEKKYIETAPETIKDWLENKKVPLREKFHAIRNLLIRIKAPEALIPDENLFQ